MSAGAKRRPYHPYPCPVCRANGTSHPDKMCTACVASAERMKPSERHKRVTLARSGIRKRIAARAARVTVNSR